MKLLAIETATRSLSCALREGGAPVAGFSLVAGQRHAEVLMPAVDHLCRQAGWDVSDLEAVAVDHGPGLFTGLRVGLATARAVAAARRLPAVGVSSLDALAYPHRRRPGLLAAVVDAKRGEVFWALYQGNGADLEQLRGPAVAPPTALAGELAAIARELAAHPGEVAALPAGSPRLLAVGDGAWRYRDELLVAGAEIGGQDDLWPTAEAVGAIGWRRLSEEGLPDGLPSPLYLRQADVRIGWEEVSGRVGAGAGAGAGAGPPAVPGPPAGAGACRGAGSRAARARLAT